MGNRLVDWEAVGSIEGILENQKIWERSQTRCEAYCESPFSHGR